VNAAATRDDSTRRDRGPATPSEQSSGRTRTACLGGSVRPPAVWGNAPRRPRRGCKWPPGWWRRRSRRTSAARPRWVSIDQDHRHRRECCVFRTVRGNRACRGTPTSGMPCSSNCGESTTTAFQRPRTLRRPDPDHPQHGVCIARITMLARSGHSAVGTRGEPVGAVALLFGLCGRLFVGARSRRRPLQVSRSLAGRQTGAPR
jgi:hypothetical protein